jgi:hypothetical protein
VTVTCEECGTQEQVRPYRAATYRFCSYACKAKWRMKHWRGDKNPKWTGGVREKVCQYCGKTFAQHRRRAISVFAKQKFCSKKCADKGGLRYFGPDNAKWTGNPRRKHRKSKHGAWARVDQPGRGKMPSLQSAGCRATCSSHQVLQGTSRASMGSLERRHCLPLVSLGHTLWLGGSGQTRWQSRAKQGAKAR